MRDRGNIVMRVINDADCTRVRSYVKNGHARDGVFTKYRRVRTREIYRPFRRLLTITRDSRFSPMIYLTPAAELSLRRVFLTSYRVCIRERNERGCVCPQRGRLIWRIYDDFSNARPRFIKSPGAGANILRRLVLSRKGREFVRTSWLISF